MGGEGGGGVLSSSIERGDGDGDVVHVKLTSGLLTVYRFRVGCLARSGNAGLMCVCVCVSE